MHIPLKRLIGGFFIGLICLQVVLSIVWTPISADGLGPGSIASNGETYLVVTPSGTLVSWGVNEFALVGRGLLSAHPYLLRTTVLRHIVSVSCGRSCAMAVDENGVLWGWGKDRELLLSDGITLFTTPVRVMEGVAEVQVGTAHAAALKTDGTLWVWGRRTGVGRWADPQPLLEDVTSVYVSDSTSFAVRSNGELYAWGPFELEGRANVSTYEPVCIASGIRAVSYAGVAGYQCLTDDGRVFLFGTSGSSPENGRRFPYYALGQTAVAEQVQSLCYGGLIKTDKSLWTWEWEGEGHDPVLVKQHDNVVYAVNPDCFVTTDGRLHSKSLWFPVSLLGISPSVRNLFVIGTLCVGFAALIRKRQHLRFGKILLRINQSSEGRG